MVKLQIVVEYRKNIIKEITETISDVDIDVRGAEVSGGPSPAVGWIVVEVQNYVQLSKVIDKVKKLKGVVDVARDGSDQISRA